MEINGQIIIKEIDKDNYARYFGQVTEVREALGEKFGTWKGHKVAWFAGREWMIIDRISDETFAEALHQECRFAAAQLISQ